MVTNLSSKPVCRLLCLGILLVLAGCKSDSQVTATGSGNVVPAPSSVANRYGQPIGQGSPLDLAAVLARPADFKDKSVIVEGAVRRACTRKGCWMELAESLDKTKPGCRVTFKDYAFFVPTDSAGSRARVRGTVEVETVKASHVRHMEEEGATFANKNADGTANEVRLTADGVELQRQ